MSRHSSFFPPTPWRVHLWNRLTRWWIGVKQSHYRRVFIVFNPVYVSKRSITAINWNKLRLNPLVMFAEMDHVYTIHCIDTLPKGQFEELREMVTQAMDATAMGEKEIVSNNGE